MAFQYLILEASPTRTLPKRSYVVVFAHELMGTDFAETAVRATGIDVVYRGELDDTRKISVVSEAVNQAQMDGRFDLDVLLRKLAEYRPTETA